MINSNAFLRNFIPGMPILVGGVRPAEVLLPNDYDPTQAYPLLVLVPGYSDDRYYIENKFHLLAKAKDRGYIAISPNGIRNSVQQRFWKSTEACCDFVDMGWDDSKYLMNLVDEISMNFAIDQKKVYFAGHSNGGFMSNVMACDHASRVAGIIDIAGANYKDLSKCKPSEPVNVLHIHGTADETVEYNGGIMVGVAYPSALDTVNSWIDFNGCTTGSLTAGTAFSIIAALAGAETVPSVATCPAGVDVRIWTINGGVHSLIVEDNFATLVFDWMDAHPKI